MDDPESYGSDLEERRRALARRVHARDLERFFGRTALGKALDYQFQRKVSLSDIEHDLSRVAAEVQGTAKTPYRVVVDLTYRDARLHKLRGVCSCPMSFNCKHVAATMLEATDPRARSVADAAPPAPATPAAPQPALSHEVLQWIATVGRTIRGDVYPATIKQRLLYRLGPSPSWGRMTVLGLELRSAQVSADGRIVGDVARPAFGNISEKNAPKYFRDSDLDILPYIGTTFSSDPHQRRVSSPWLLRDIVATGRAFFGDRYDTPLRWGESRRGEIEWRAMNASTVSPWIVVPGLTTFLAGLPVYVDEAAGLVGPVETALPERLVRQVIAAPAIPRADVEIVSRRLAESLAPEHHAVLPAPPTPTVTIDADPVPVLRLMRGTPRFRYHHVGETRGSPAVARASFRYGPIEVPRSDRRKRIEAILDGQVFDAIRRPVFEKAVLHRLEARGLVPAVSVHPDLVPDHELDLAFPNAQAWLHALNDAVPRLRADGIEVIVDDDFPYRLAEPSGAFEATLEGSGIDWFDLTLGIEVDGERHDLAPVLAALLATPGFDPQQVRQIADEGKPLYLPLRDGRHIALAADRLLPVILALSDLLLTRSSASAQGRMRLSRADALAATAFETDGFAFTAAESLRRLAGLVSTEGFQAPRLPDSFGAELRPYQATGVGWLDRLREAGLGGVLADDMGLGKTIQLLALLAIEKARGHMDRPSLVVCPTSLTANWSSEAAKVAPDLSVLVLHGTDRKRRFPEIPQHDLVVSTYPLIARDHEVLLAQNWHVVALDEAQTIKNPDAATTRLVSGLEARHRFCLTGTPMENHLGELWSVLSFANPGYLGDKTGFSRQWRHPIEKRGDSARAAALARRVKPFLLRRTKAEVATELPPKTEIVERITLEGAQRDLYDSIRLSMSDKVREAIAARGLARSHIVVLEALLRLRQACCDPALLKLEDGIGRGSAKLERLLEMIAELRREGHKILVFSQFTSMIERIRSRLEGDGATYSLLTGDTKDRAAAIERFESGASDVFLISLKAGGVGLNLTAADTVILFDPWWNPAVEEQAIDRAYRIGQDQAVFVYRLVAAGTIEEKMEELKARKRALADGVFERDGTLATALTEDDIRALFET